jgi:hypothetical protein
MNTTRSTNAGFALAFLLSIFNSQLSTARAQGSLTPPPGPPSPTMKSLDQVEPRIPIPGGNSSFFISTPGSYYLTGDIIITNDFVDGIDIDASNVTVDLKGYSIVCTKSLPQNNEGISANYSPAPSNLTIRNGRVMGFQTGVLSRNNNTTVENMALSDIRRWGINIIGSGTNGFVTNIRDNTIVNVDLNQSGSPNNRATGILIQNASGIIEHNSITGLIGLAGSPSLIGVGMDIESSSDGFLEVVNNRVANADAGFYFLAGTIGYRDNIVLAATTHYLGGATNLGNNY